MPYITYQNSVWYEATFFRHLHVSERISSHHDSLTARSVLRGHSAFLKGKNFLVILNSSVKIAIILYFKNTNKLGITVYWKPLHGHSLSVVDFDV